MNPIDHMRARALRDALDRAVPELEYVLSRWRGSAPRDVRQIEVPGIEHPDPVSDDAFASMLDALDVLTQALADDDLALACAGPTARARAALDCQCALVLHDRRELGSEVQP